MNKLANQLIKLGHTHPELRDDLRPILDHLSREAGLFDKIKRVLKRDGRDEELSWLDRVDEALVKGGYRSGLSPQKGFAGYSNPVSETRDGFQVRLSWPCGARGVSLYIQEVRMTGAAEIELFVDNKKKLDVLAPARSLERTIQNMLARVSEELEACGGL